MSLHRACRAKVVDYFHSMDIRHGVILIKGGEESNQYETDIELVFRQDSWFNYLFGVMEPGKLNQFYVVFKHLIVLWDWIRILGHLIHLDGCSYLADAAPLS